MTLLTPGQFFYEKNYGDFVFAVSLKVALRITYPVLKSPKRPVSYIKAPGSISKPTGSPKAPGSPRHTSKTKPKYPV